MDAHGASAEVDPILTEEAPQALDFPIQDWKKQDSLPPVPVFRQRNRTFAVRYVGTLNRNMRVKLPEELRTPRRHWNNDPTDAQCPPTRRNGAKVWMRLALGNITGSVIFEFIDQNFMFVQREAVDVEPWIDLEALRKECALAFFIEYYTRMDAYNRDVRVYEVRIKLFLSWHPPRDDFVSKIQTREFQMDAALVALRKHGIKMEKWSMASLEQESNIVHDSHRRELDRIGDYLEHANITTTDDLIEAISETVPLADFCGQDIFESSIDNTTLTLRDDFLLDIDDGDPKLEAASCIDSGKFAGKVVKGQVLVALCLVLDWSRADLVARRPDRAGKVKNLFW